MCSWSRKVSASTLASGPNSRRETCCAWVCSAADTSRTAATSSLTPSTRAPSSATSGTPRNATTSASTPVCRFLSGVGVDGFIRRTRAAGSSGTADAGWVAGCQVRTIGRSGDGGPSAGTRARCAYTACRVTTRVGRSSVRRCRTVHTTVGRSESPDHRFGAHCSDRARMHARSFGRRQGMSWRGSVPLVRSPPPQAHREEAHAPGQASDRDPSLRRHVCG